ncbi:hypothetical protein HWV62_8873 [Athelia sp. TMB]|nr:hypothetical protein HWV62_8873 [Athelia sp. TMB]
MSYQDQWGGQPPQGYSNGAGPNPGYAPNYAPPPQAPYQQNPYNGEQKSPYDGDRFKPKKRLNDPIFLVFFVLQFLGFAALSGIVLSEWISEGGLGGGAGSGNTGTSVTLDSGVCVYYWITKYYSGAIIFTIIALFSVLSYFGFRSRIPLASLLLQVIMDVSKHHMSVYVVAFTALFLQAALSVYAKWTPGNPSCDSGSSCSSGKVAGLIFFEVFSFLWTSQVIGNVSLATLAGGPYGSWYYFGPREHGQMPKNPTLSAFGRASTLSLGSIAFGSLIVTLLEILQMFCRAVQNNAAQDGNGQSLVNYELPRVLTPADATGVEVCLACCANCLIGILESAVQYFNRYAYIEISLYGKPYIPAAKDTWRLFKDRGIDALINDSLVSMTLTWGAYVVGMFCSLFGYIYLRSLTLASAIEAGVSTIFVGLGEDSQVLAIRAPELFGVCKKIEKYVARRIRACVTTEL